MLKKIICCILFYTSILISQTYYYPFYNYRTLDANNIEFNLNNYGSLERFGGFNGATWNRLAGKTIVYDHGIWVVGKINNQPRAAFAQWRSGYTPGPIVNGKPAVLVNPEDSAKYRVYKISKGDDNSNPDYSEWPANLGAPVDQSGNPHVYGDQSLWTVYNSADSNNKNLLWWNDLQVNAPVLPLEIHQLAFSRKGHFPDSIDIFSNVVFFEWTIINKGNYSIDSAYFSLWTDIDFLSFTENYPAVDTSLQIGYCWSKYDQEVIPPAVGYLLLYGPAVPSPGNSAIYKGRNIQDAKNLDLSSFHFILDDWPVPPGNIATSIIEAWNIARGFDSNGNTFIDSITHQQTYFPASGDPVTNSGWIITDQTGGGAGFNLFSGPFNLAPNDTQWVMMALVPGIGKNKFQSIEYMRKKAALLRTSSYDSLAFGSSALVVGVDSDKEYVPQKFMLHQNYPNPFNPETIIKYHLPKNTFVNIKVYDMLGREIAVLVNEEKAAGEYFVNFSGAGISSGVYFYSVQTNEVNEVKKMILMK